MFDHINSILAQLDGVQIELAERDFGYLDKVEEQICKKYYQILKQEII